LEGPEILRVRSISSSFVINYICIFVLVQRTLFSQTVCNQQWPWRENIRVDLFTILIDERELDLGFRYIVTMHTRILAIHLAYQASCMILMEMTRDLQQEGRSSLNCIINNEDLELSFVEELVNVPLLFTLGIVTL